MSGLPCTMACDPKVSTTTSEKLFRERSKDNDNDEIELKLSWKYVEKCEVKAWRESNLPGREEQN
jgi:hypothetical protein